MAKILNFQDSLNEQHAQQDQERTQWLINFMTGGLEFSIDEIQNLMQCSEAVFESVSINQFEKMSETSGQKALFQKFQEGDAFVIEIFYLMLRDFRKIKKSIFLASHIAAKMFGSEHAVNLFYTAELKCRDEYKALCEKTFSP